MTIQKNEAESGVISDDSCNLFLNESHPDDNPFSVVSWFKFIFLSSLLIVPIFAIVNSMINENWVMVFVDALLVPLGFVHGLLLLFGIVD